MQCITRQFFFLASNLIFLLSFSTCTSIRTYEELAIGVLNECYEEDEERSALLLVCELPFWGNSTCLTIAVNAEDMNFIAHSGVQNLLNQIWMGKISEETSMLQVGQMHRTWASKETYHFFRATLTKIQRIKMNHIWTQISCITTLEMHIWKKTITGVSLKPKGIKLQWNCKRSFVKITEIACLPGSANAMDKSR